MIVVGLGTGRCGTHSLAELLNLQPGSDVYHEAKPPLLWRNEPNPTRHLRRQAKLVGDVGFYYLPHVGQVWDALPEARFVCLIRPRAETVASFVRYMPRERNWLQSYGDRSGWDASFPTYDSSLTFEQAAGAYWDEYYDRATDLECDRFRVFPMENLNTQAGVEQILRFVCVDEPRVIVGIKREATR